jgi:hypothetical protein
MGWRFQKRISVLPGVKLNISKGGVSVRTGVSGAGITFARRGVRGTVGLPGSGLYYTEMITKRKPSATEDRWVAGAMTVVVLFFVVMWFISLLAG